MNEESIDEIDDLRRRLITSSQEECSGCAVSPKIDRSLIAVDNIASPLRFFSLFFLGEISRPFLSAIYIRLSHLLRDYRSGKRAYHATCYLHGL